jgi:GTPase SAR1 family protein
MPSSRSRSGGTIQQVGEPQGDPQQAIQPTPAVRTPPALPTAKTKSGGSLESKMVVLYGPPGVGKSTLASTWAGGDVFFFNCAGELGDIEAYQESIGSWADFRNYAWAIAEAVKKGDVPYRGSVIDTADVLGRYCAETVRKRLNIAHESDADYGKGWAALRDEFALNVAKLSSLSDFGVIFVAHAEEREVKTRSTTYDKWQIRGVKAIRETMQDMADLVLFIDYSDDDDERRVIKTKPSRYWDAKERGQVPRLPAEIEWPLGENGWEIIKAAWEANDGS